MAERRLAHVIRFTAALGHHRIRGACQHDAPIQILFAENLPKLVRQPMICGHINVQRRAPLSIVNHPVGRRWENRGSIDQDVYPAIYGITSRNALRIASRSRISMDTTVAASGLVV